MERSLKILDREIDPNELLLIRERIEPAGDRGRTYISKELCQIWDWRLPNDQLQDIACRDLLRRLEKRGLIQLPPPLRAACRAGYMRVKTARAGCLAQNTSLSSAFVRVAPAKWHRKCLAANKKRCQSSIGKFSGPIS